MKCDFDPITYTNEPLGMFHCPQCGEMVIAGVPHPDYDYINKSIDDFYKEYEEEK